MSTSLRGNERFESMDSLVAHYRTFAADELVGMLERELSLTAEHMRKAAAIVRVLDEMGVDAGRTNDEMLKFLRLIAHGQLQPEAFVRFFGAKDLLRRVRSLPAPDQIRLGNGGKVEVAVRRGDGYDTRLVDPVHMAREQVKLVFDDGRILPVPEQIAKLDAMHTPEPEHRPPVPFRVVADAKSGTLRVGRYELKVGEVLRAIGELAAFDPDEADGSPGSCALDPDVNAYLRRLASHQGVTIKHLVRMAVLRTYQGEGWAHE